MGLLDGGIARIFNATFSALYLDGILHHGTGEPIYDEAGTIVGYSDPGDQPIKVQIDAATDAMRRAEGFAEGDVRLIILTTYGQSDGTTETDHSDGTPYSDGSSYSQATYGYVEQLDSDMEVTVQGVRYRLQSVERDPALSHWVCRGRRA